jgi:homogentisate 1,2-dioxygenase
VLDVVVHHGPHPNAAKNAEDKISTEEIAVMVDTQRPLRPSRAAESVEYAEYFMSWKADQGR